MQQILRFLYRTVPGRLLLKLLTRPALSRIAGRFMDGAASKCLIPGFVRKNAIDLSEYEQEEYSCFNDFFCRKIRPECRPFDPDPTHLIAPCDGLLSIYDICDGTVLPVKQSSYTVERLLRDPKQAGEFDGGLCLVFRLCVHHYHRYVYFDSGVQGDNIFLPGILHTVQPVALEQYPVFTENAREYTVMQTDHFGTAIQMEVGALLVGKIENLHGAGPMTRGEEKGRFLYGGSTIVVLLRKDAVRLLPAFADAKNTGREIPVRMGEWIGNRE